MLTTVNAQPTLWEAILPEAVLGLPAELEAVDSLLDDAVFFEPLCREVADSISWQRFCRIRLGASTPHPTTLRKITTRCGVDVVDGLNEALLAKAAAARVFKTNRMRADTTVVEADVAYPTASGLMTKGVATMAATIREIKAAGLATGTKTRDRTRTARSRAAPRQVRLPTSSRSPTVRSPRRSRTR